MRIDKAEIILNNIKIHAFHGVLPEERVHGTDYIVSIRCNLDDAGNIVEKILSDDDLNDTIDYSLLNTIIEEEMQKPSNLIEHVAARIGTRILQIPQIADTMVTVEKLNPPMPGNCHSASVCIKMHK